jgi:hypothetical protein
MIVERKSYIQITTYFNPADIKYFQRNAGSIFIKNMEELK